MGDTGEERSLCSNEHPAAGGTDPSCKDIAKRQRAQQFVACDRTPLRRVI